MKASADYRTFRLERLDTDKRQRGDTRRMARARKLAAYVWGDEFARF